MERIWHGRLTRQFNHARFGLPRPLWADIIRSIWRSVEEELVDVPYQMQWFWFMGSEPIEAGIVLAYHIIVDVTS